MWIICLLVLYSSVLYSIFDVSVFIIGVVLFINLMFESAFILERNDKIKIIKNCIKDMINNIITYFLLLLLSLLCLLFRDFFDLYNFAVSSKLYSSFSFLKMSFKS